MHLYIHACVCVSTIQDCMIPYSTDPHSRGTKLDIRHPAHSDHQGAQVWRVAWNVTGTILASSGDDGCVRLWKGV